MNTAKEEVIRRILDVTDQVAGEVLDFLEHLDTKEKRKNPFVNCPIDDEPVTPEEAAAIRKAEAEEGGTPWEEIQKEMGL